MTLNAKIGGFIDFIWRFQATTQVYIIHQVVPCYLSLCDPDREFSICILTSREHPFFS